MTTATKILSDKPGRSSRDSSQEKGPKAQRDPRRGLLISATTATLFAIAGHLFLGFEQSLAQLTVALIAGYGAALLFEAIDAAMMGRSPRWLGNGTSGVGKFLLSAHMTAITISFLLYVNNHLWIMAFAVIAAIGSKHIFRIRNGERLRHFMNPSNFGIALTLLLFPWTTVIPYEYTEGFGGWSSPGRVILPLAIVILGTRLNALYTRRLPLIATWLTVFALQALIRGLVTDAPLFAGMTAMTGVAFVLFTFYMITDPMTSPSSTRGQIIFGLAMGLVYAALMAAHVIFTLFFAVTMVCAVRGLLLVVSARRSAEATQKEPVSQPKPAVPAYARSMSQ